MLRRLETRVPPPLLMIAFSALVWATGWMMPEPAWSGALRLWLATALFAVAGLFGFPAIAAFRRARTTINPIRVDQASTLVTQGLFRISRNPMYVSLVLLLLAWSVFLGPVWGMVGVAVFALWIDQLQIRPEERVLAQKFGAGYAAYRGRVRRWL